MRLAQRKRPLALLRMLRHAQAQLPPEVRLRALIIGDGPERRTLQRYLDRHAMGWVQLTGRYTREQIREVYRRADLFIAPANLESFGIAALEARAAGLPVLAKANSGIREFVTHGVEGLLAASDTDLADGIVRLARSPELRGRIAAHNRTTLRLGRRARPHRPRLQGRYRTLRTGVSPVNRFMEPQMLGVVGRSAARSSPTVPCVRRPSS
jgi:glycosyltransferase involved in cell wall biosynthesis